MNSQNMIAQTARCHPFTSAKPHTVAPSPSLGRDRVVGIATRYGLDSPGSNIFGNEIFHTRPVQTWCPPILLYNGYRDFPGCKQLWRDIEHIQPSRTEVIEYSYICTPIFVAYSTLNFTFTYTSPSLPKHVLQKYTFL